MVKTPRKNKIIDFTKKQSNVQGLVNLHIRPIILLGRQYCLQEVLVRFYILIKITAEKVSINDFCRW